MEDSTVLIRHQMEQTRASLQEKLETLENQVVDSVQDAAHTVKDTVQLVKDAVEETVGTVRGSVREAMCSVKETLDVTHQVREHPWMMMLGSVAVGYVGERLLEQVENQMAPSSSPAFHSEPSRASSYTETNGKAAWEANRSSGVSSWLHSLAEEYRPELNSLKSLAIGTAMGIVRDMVRSNAPPQVGEQLADVVDSLTSKIGGKPIQGPVIS